MQKFLYSGTFSKQILVYSGAFSLSRYFLQRSFFFLMQNFFCSGAFALSRISYTAELSSLSKMSFTVGLFFKAEFFQYSIQQSFL